MLAGARVDVERRAATGENLAQLELASLFDRCGEHDRAREWLERAAASGDPLARTMLAEVLLSRTPYDISRGMSLVRDAAQQGNARAAHLLALLIAAGVRQTQNWTVAVEVLMAAALGGWQLAQDALASTSSNVTLAKDALRSRSTEVQVWRNIAKAVDLRPFFLVPRPEIVSAEPRIAAVGRFLSPGLCDWLIARARPLLRPAEVYDPDNGRMIVDPNRNNRAALFPLVLSDLLLLLIRERISRVIGLPAAFMEHSAVLHYAPGEEYRPHWDYCDLTLPGPAKDAADNGQRVLTFVVYLNDDYEGGETGFPRISRRFRGRKGDALFWWNVDPQGAPDAGTLHAGLTPRAGEKWLFSQWTRDRPEILYR